MIKPDTIWTDPPPDDALDDLVFSGNTSGLRALFNKTFWEGEQVRPIWSNIKFALQHEDREMLRLLITYYEGMPTEMDLGILKIEAEDKYPHYIRLLGQCGLKLPASLLESVDIVAAKAKFLIETHYPQKPTPALTPGQAVPGEGIYIGQYSPKDSVGVSLGKTFNAFAAPEDLTDASGKKATFTYVDTVKRMSGLKKFHGHDGEGYENAQELYTALRNRSYKGGWVIPTRELLTGIKADSLARSNFTRHKSDHVQPDNLFNHKNTSSFKGTFATEVGLTELVFLTWYWSCTNTHNDPSYVWDAMLSDAPLYEGPTKKNEERLSCRPVRLVEISNSQPPPSDPSRIKFKFKV